jgi:hypothetical protein
LTEEQFRQIRESQRRIESSVSRIEWMVGVLLAIAVVIPILQQFGLYNLMGIGE